MRDCKHTVAAYGPEKNCTFHAHRHRDVLGSDMEASPMTPRRGGLTGRWMSSRRLAGAGRCLLQGSARRDGAVPSGAGVDEGSDEHEPSISAGPGDRATESCLGS